MAEGGPERVDPAAIFAKLVQKFEGKTKLNNIKDCFPAGYVDVRVAGWFRRRKNSKFILFENDEGTAHMVGIKHPNVHLCQDYVHGRCNDKDCQDFHICRNDLAGYCEAGLSCDKSHSYQDEHNIKIVRGLKLDKFSAENMQVILQQSTLQVCLSYNHQTAKCQHADKCIRLHICKKFVQQNCYPVDDEKCPLAHNLDSAHSQRLLKSYNLHEKTQEEVVHQLLLLKRNPTAERKTRADRQKSNLNYHQKLLLSRRQKREDLEDEEDETPLATKVYDVPKDEIQFDSENEDEQIAIIIQQSFDDELEKLGNNEKEVQAEDNNSDVEEACVPVDFEETDAEVNALENCELQSDIEDRLQQAFDVDTTEREDDVDALSFEDQMKLALKRSTLLAVQEDAIARSVSGSLKETDLEKANEDSNYKQSDAEIDIVASPLRMSPLTIDQELGTQNKLLPSGSDKTLKEVIEEVNRLPGRRQIELAKTKSTMETLRKKVPSMKPEQLKYANLHKREPRIPGSHLLGNRETGLTEEQEVELAIKNSLEESNKLMEKDASRQMPRTLEQERFKPGSAATEDEILDGHDNYQEQENEVSYYKETDPEIDIVASPLERSPLNIDQEVVTPNKTLKEVIEEVNRLPGRRQIELAKTKSTMETLRKKVPSMKPEQFKYANLHKREPRIPGSHLPRNRETGLTEEQEVELAVKTSLEESAKFMGKDASRQMPRTLEQERFKPGSAATESEILDGDENYQDQGSNYDASHSENRNFSRPMPTFQMTSGEMEPQPAQTQSRGARPKQNLVEIHLHNDDEERQICEAHLRGGCGWGDMCPKHHWRNTYLWQVKVKGSWVNIEDEDVEKYYCDTDLMVKDTKIEIPVMDATITVTIHYKSMDATIEHEIHVSDEKAPVRRLSTPSTIKVRSGPAPPKLTRWCWRYLSSAGEWKEFTQENQKKLEGAFVVAKEENVTIIEQIISQQTREKIKEEFKVNLTVMTSEGLSDGIIREVCRRPVWNSLE